ncbi:MAG: bifunctional riboflavin kinase/FAD synthetase [Oscillospiraceae bacterium]|nr:bifunctional riboflavin kinase/FAD synthetase [Oscillospiraceae bacterium]
MNNNPNVYKSIVNIKEPTAVALGFFDGVHTGHRQILSAAAAQAANGLLPVVLTFNTRPAAAIAENPPENLTTKQAKEDAFKATGIKQTIFADFFELCRLTPQEFAVEILQKKLNCKKVFCGYNYKFGQNRVGDVGLLQALCASFDCEVEVIAPYTIEGGAVLSSSVLREMIKNGDVEQANRFLFKPFNVCGEVIHGRQLGRAINMPTLNVQPPSELICPKKGVYAAKVLLRGEEYIGITNFGVRPTVDGKTALYEAWLPDYKGDDFYGEQVQITLHKFIRSEKKFGTLQELQSAVKKDLVLVYEGFVQ